MVRTAVVLVLLSVLPSTAHAEKRKPGPTPEEYVAHIRGAQLVPAGELLLDGRRVQCGLRPTVLDNQLNDYGAAYPRFVILNPRLLAQLATPVKLWVYTQVCGYISLGYDSLSYDPSVADCLAVQRGRRQGWLTPQGLDEVCTFVGGAHHTKRHLPGPKRCEQMRKCYEKNARETATDRPKKEGDKRR